jgi:type IV secretion system protein VirB9
MKKLTAIAALILLSVVPFAVSSRQAHAGDDFEHSRRVQYGEDDVIRVRTKLRFTTLIVLPKDETILDFTCGDKEFWVINGAKNLVYCKPARAGAETNLNLVAASGNVYSFILTEVSGDAEAAPDLKVFVEAKEGSVLTGIKGERRYVAAEEASFYRDEVALARAEAKEARTEAEKAAQSRIDQFQAGYAARLRFGYRFVPNRKPFFVSAIWNDGRFTYIRAATRETPALYELKDGRANLVAFDFRDGLFTVGKVIDSGYLAIGKARFPFARAEAK